MVSVKNRYYTSCSRSSYDGSKMCWKHSNTCNSKSMSDIISSGRLCEVKDFTKKVKSRRLSRVIPSMICGDFPDRIGSPPFLRLYITENMKLKMLEMCRIFDDDVSETIIKKPAPSPPKSSIPPRINISSANSDADVAANSAADVAANSDADVAADSDSQF